MIYQREIQLRTTGHRQMHDLTAEIAQVVSDSRIRTGVANIFNVGSTGAIGTIEFEPGLQQDLPAMLDKLFPPSREYGHEQAWHDGNGHSHLQATMLGPSLTVPHQRGEFGFGSVAASFPFGVRRQTPATDNRHHRNGRGVTAEMNRYGKSARHSTARSWPKIP